MKENKLKDIVKEYPSEKGYIIEKYSLGVFWLNEHDEKAYSDRHNNRMVTMFDVIIYDEHDFPIRRCWAFKEIDE